MMENKRQLIDEHTSPLQRIMWVYNVEEPQPVGRRTFENNICAFHIGKGYFLTVAHNLRTQAGYFKSIEEEVYNRELLYKLDGFQKSFLDQHYFLDDYTHKMYLNHANAQVLHDIAGILKQKRFDTRWVTMAEKKICVPHVVIQFRGNTFYKEEDVFQYFKPHQIFTEPDFKKNNYLLEVELVEAFYSADIALYRTVNVPDEVIAMIPAVDVNCDFMDEDPNSLHCLQSDPNSTGGRLLNQAKLEGILDHIGMFTDDIGGNYPFDGFRYLIKGYFRFGTSGAPYLVYDPIRGKYVANAIQSEASGIQFTTKDGKEGNFQYTHAIASPLYLIKEKLRALKIGDMSGFEHVF